MRTSQFTTKSKKPRSPITVASGDDFRIEWTKGVGFDLFILGRYVGGFDTIQQAREARNEIRFDALRRA